MTAIRAAITQTTWTGDKESMLDKHEQFAREAKAQGAQVICFQELFYSPYLGITEDVKYYDFAEPADGPIVQRFAALAAELSMVAVLPIFEEEQPGVYYNTAVVVDADGTVLGKYRKNHIPNLDKSWEKFYFRPGTLGYRCSRPPSARSGCTSAYDRHFPEGTRELPCCVASLIRSRADSGTELGLLDPQGRHHAVPDRHEAADVPGVLGHQAVVLLD